MGNSFGERFRVTSFGESHGRCVGVVVDGCPAGLSISDADIQRELDRRRPSQSPFTAGRAESDRLELLSGVFNGFTTGAPICMLVWNIDADSRSYEKIRWTPRPGHADYPAHVKYGGLNDYRGGGRFSGRITAGLVMAGAVSKRLIAEALKVEVLAYTKEIGHVRSREMSVNEIRMNTESNPVRCPDPDSATRMMEEITTVANQGDSLGGIVECLALNVPVRVGEPVFDALDADISKALFAIPAVKAVEFGAGRYLANVRGSESNDVYVLRDGKVATDTNRMGGILGGLSNGMPIVCRATFKPTPSIRMPQRTVDLSSMEEVEIAVDGRHDPCIVPRAVPVVEAMVALVLADHAIRAGLIPPVLGRDFNGIR